MKMTATEHAGMPSVPNAPLYYIVQEDLGLCIVQLVRTSFALVASLSLHNAFSSANSEECSGKSL